MPLEPNIMFRTENAPDLSFIWVLSGRKMPKICTALCLFLKVRKEGYPRTGYPIFLERILEMYLRKNRKEIMMWYKKS